MRNKEAWLSQAVACQDEKEEIVKVERKYLNLFLFIIDEVDL